MTKNTTAKILIVDDDTVMRLMIRKSLEKLKYDCVELTDGQSAVNQFYSIKPDIILMDGMMPIMDGFEACRKIRQSPYGRDLPIVMVTGLDDIESIKDAYYAGATTFISKPIRQHILQFNVRYILRGSRAIKSLAISEQRLQQAQKIAKLGHWEWDPKSGQFYISSQIFRLFEMPLIGTNSDRKILFSRIHPEDLEHVTPIFEKVNRDMDSQEIDYRIIMPNKSEKVVHEHIQTNYDQAGKRTIVGIIQDVTEQKLNEKKIHNLAYYDQLTKIPNKLTTLKYCQALINSNQSLEQIVAFIFIDLDGFHRINETFGHKIGDQLLCKIARHLDQHIHYLDKDILLSRHGGDEFTLIVPNSSRDSARIIAQSILDCLATPYHIEGLDLFITCSIGISFYPYHGRDPDTLVKNAETAMYRVKYEGKNNTKVYRAEMNESAYQRLSLDNKLRKALDKEDFYLLYQPQVDLSSNKIVGLEALLRWRDNDLGQISPNKFIPLAEENGLIIPIGEWVLYTACQQNKAFQDLNFAPIRMGVNLSSRQFRQHNIINIIENILKQTKLDANYLELEMTERIVMQNITSTIKTLSTIKELGCQLSIDDFGTGYSSLSYLTQFPINTLKIDRAFVIDIIKNKQNASITKAIIAMAHSLDLRVIAEGVEEKNQWDYLCGLDCDEIQGYYFSRPQDSNTICELLMKQNGSLILDS